MPTRLVILAPANLHREAWRALLSGQPDISVVAAIADVSAAASFPLFSQSQPATLLIDLPAPPPDLARQLRATAPGWGLLFLVPSYDLADIVSLLQAGATGCISRDDSVGDLARAIIAAGRGELVLPSAIAAQALVAIAQGEGVDDAQTEALSEREAEILRLLAQGLTNKDIAQTLILSVRTVEAHLRNIFAKLGVRSRTEAALWAVKHGYGPQE